jgi:hypothetical protein
VVSTPPISPTPSRIGVFARKFAQWILSAPQSSPPAWVNSVVGVLEHNLVTLPAGILGGVVGLVFPRMFYLCGFCILLAVHRVGVVKGKKRIIQFGTYITLGIIIVVATHKLTVVVQEKLNDCNTALAKLVASFVAKTVGVSGSFGGR